MSFAEAAVASRFHSWRGHSGRRFVTSVFEADSALPDSGLPELDGAVVIPIRRAGASRVPLGIFRLERNSDRRVVLAAGLMEGVDEWHVHLLATTVAARVAVVADLRLQRSSSSRELAA